MSTPPPDPAHYGELTALPQCSQCMFRFTEAMACVAFPRGIPAGIATGAIDHTKPYPGDGDIRFLPRVTDATAAGARRDRGLFAL